MKYIFNSIEWSIEKYRYIYAALLAVFFVYVSLRGNGSDKDYGPLIESVVSQNKIMMDSYRHLPAVIEELDGTLRSMNTQYRKDYIVNIRKFNELTDSDKVLHNKINYYVSDYMEKSRATDIKLDKLWYKIDSIHRINDKWENELRRDKE